MRRLVMFASVAAILAGPSVALASPGTPPTGMSPIAGSLYKAQFALCSLDTIDGLARSEHIALGTLTLGAGALRIAQAHEQDLGTAAVQGCRAGLLYRYRNDEQVAGLRSDLSQRVTAEKYVIAVYGLIVIAFFLYVMIHAAKVARLERETSALTRRLEEAAIVTQSPASPR